MDTLIVAYKQWNIVNLKFSGSELLLQIISSEFKNPVHPDGFSHAIDTISMG